MGVIVKLRYCLTLFNELTPTVVPSFIKVKEKKVIINTTLV